MRKIVIHGATNTSNFGDVLFARLFYERCLSLPDSDVYFLQMPLWGIGEFCRKELKYNKKLSFFGFLKADVLVLMSGGYLGDDKCSKRNTVKRYFRYILPARLFQLLRKPVYILGVGGGPLDSPFLRKRVVKLLNAASVITFRDEETQEYFVDYGLTSISSVTSDTAQVITKDLLPDLETEIEEEIRRKLGNKTLIFLHAVFNETTDGLIAERIIPAINSFMKSHPDYGIIIGADSESRSRKIEDLRIYNELTTDFKCTYRYNSGWKLCALLNNTVLVITTKLHVGIVSASLGKSVLSFPTHREKVQRYYRQINQEDRTKRLSEVSCEFVLEQLNKYYNVPIEIGNSIRDKAKQNLDLLSKIDRA